MSRVEEILDKARQNTEERAAADLTERAQHRGRLEREQAEAFTLLQKFQIEDSLRSIRDEIWKVGDVSTQQLPDIASITNPKVLSGQATCALSLRIPTYYPEGLVGAHNDYGEYRGGFTTPSGVGCADEIISITANTAGEYGKISPYHHRLRIEVYYTEFDKIPKELDPHPSVTHYNYPHETTFRWIGLGRYLRQVIYLETDGLPHRYYTIDSQEVESKLADFLALDCMRRKTVSYPQIVQSNLEEIYERAKKEPHILTAKARELLQKTENLLRNQ